MILLKPGEVCKVKNCPYCNQKEFDKFGCFGKNPNRKNFFRCELKVN